MAETPPPHPTELPRPTVKPPRVRRPRKPEWPVILIVVLVVVVAFGALCAVLS